MSDQEKMTEDSGLNRAISEGVRESWKVKETSDKRCTRHGVVVDGVAYKSTRAAFEALGLPMEKHIKFRGQLKAEGMAVAFGRFWRLDL